MQPFECSGLWWLPNDEVHQAAGTLKVSANGDIHLALIGSLDSEDAVSLNMHIRHPIVLGLVELKPCGELVTLISCALTGRTLNSFSLTSTRYHASKGYFGGHLTEDWHFFPKEITLELGGLTSWAESLCGIRASFPFQPSETDTHLLSFRQHPPLTSEIPNGQAKLGMCLSKNHTGHQVTYSERATLQFTFSSPEKDDSVSRKLIYHFQNLMTFVTDEPQKVESVSIKVDQGRCDTADSGSIRIIQPRVYPEEEEGEERSISKHEMLFSLDDVDFSPFVEKWLEFSNRHEEACNIYFGLQYGPPAYIDTTFLGVMQAVHLYFCRTEEGLQQRSREQELLLDVIESVSTACKEWILDHIGPDPYPSFAFAIQRLLLRHRLVIDPLISGRHDRFISDTITTLHYLIHRDQELATSASHGANLYWKIETLKFLLKACFLSELSFEDHAINQMFKRNPLYLRAIQIEKERESVEMKQASDPSREDWPPSSDSV